MSRRMKTNTHIVDGDFFAQFGDLRRLHEILAVAQRHDVEGLLCGENGAVTCASVVCMAVRDQCAINRP
jgi:hypothetical protein